MKGCKTCRYLGIVLDHLKGYEGIECWQHCKVYDDST